MNNRMEASVALLLHRGQLSRLRLERAAARALGRGPRVLATACWDFPIYSQTFVYQELTQLARRGFSLRFVYSKLNPQSDLPAQFSPVWRARRRLLLHPAVCDGARDDYSRRMPDRVAKLTALICEASGLSPEAIDDHRHFQQAFAFTSLVEAHGPDYLHSYFFYEGTFFTFCASFLLGIPRGVSCYADHMLDDYDLKLVPLHLRQCAVVIATSARIRQELLAISSHADAGTIVVKPNGINSSRFPRVAQVEPGVGGTFRLVCVSRIEPKKGLLYLLEAVRILRDRQVPVELHILGGVDPSASSADYAREVAARHESLGLKGIVHLEGRKSETEIRERYRNSHLYVAPFVETESGDKDGIPTSLLEAMASGMPVVATDAGSITEVIEHGQSGVIVAQRNADGLANAIQALLEDPARRMALGDAAAVRVRQYFDVTTCEAGFHERIRHLAGRPATVLDMATEGSHSA